MSGPSKPWLPYKINNHGGGGGGFLSKVLVEMKVE